ncbi:hypothetical protein R3W88_024401 [Solanum pinnatisectum]|uniref:Uncharacterized protein n=1 Tax=Solanum pinnatisectum TaxID=50273 RepID=A0AAV9M110_9SOLN|nr:hypothetical protein R3W88_024401 [Solanum pinnatisectum]
MSPLFQTCYGTLIVSQRSSTEPYIYSFLDDEPHLWYHKNIMIKMLWLNSFVYYTILSKESMFQDHSE